MVSALAPAAGAAGCTVVHVRAPSGDVKTDWYPGVVILRNPDAGGSLAADMRGVGLMGWDGSFTLGYGHTQVVLNPPADSAITFPTEAASDRLPEIVKSNDTRHEK